jgi:hypothetical protein
MDSETVKPLVPLIRALVQEPRGSDAFEAALRHSAPEDREFELEIVRHQLSVERRKQAAVQERMAELCEQYPVIGDAARKETPW